MPPEETSTAAIEAPEEQPAEEGEPAPEPSNGAVEARDGVREAPLDEEPIEDAEASIREVPVTRHEDEDEDVEPEPDVTESEVTEPEAVEPEIVEPEPVQAREVEVVEEGPVEDVPVDVEAEESGGWFGRLRQGLSRSRESFVGQLNAAVAEFKDAEDEEFWERVEEILITSDVGVPTTAKLVAELEQEALEKNITSGRELRELMIEHATRMLEGPVELDVSHNPTVILMVGVNGTGKATTIGKL